MSEIIQPVHKCDDGLFNAASGKLISIHDPKPEMFCIQDIASGLSKICRFGGQIKDFYSVAQHSVYVAALDAHYKEDYDKLSLLGLMHDAPEAYLGDVIKPLKNVIGSVYEDIEDRFEKIIFEYFGLIGTSKDCKPADASMLSYEHDYIYRTSDNMDAVHQLAMRIMMPALRHEKFSPWSPDKAEYIFLEAAGMAR